MLDQNSASKLSRCHPDLQKIIFTAARLLKIKSVIIVVWGFRDEKSQNEAYAKGFSDKKWPDSKHNKQPSMAVDLAFDDMVNDGKLTIDWNDEARFRYLGGFIMGVAAMLLEKGEITHGVRCGQDWDGDTEVKDNKRLNDLGHFELI